jgi:hypothetical protein
MDGSWRMNAHPDSIKAKRDPQQRSRLIDDECEQMLRILDAQIADLSAVTDQLQRKRQEWADRLDQNRLSLPMPTGRAQRGAVTTMVLNELRLADDGMTGAALVRRVSALLPTMNPQSVRQALQRLKQQGDVVQSGKLWIRT